MSLVGPRPLILSEADLVSGDQRRRFRMRPGITGLWQIGGRSDAPTSMIELDLRYIDNWSLLLDLKIILKTVIAVILAKGAR
jgi:lipopolysaccharide/colanic/teichoic acid biosynthesis glycosyltransferase